RHGVELVRHEHAGRGAARVRVHRLGGDVADGVRRQPGGDHALRSAAGAPARRGSDERAGWWYPARQPSVGDEVTEPEVTSSESDEPAPRGGGRIRTLALAAAAALGMLGGLGAFTFGYGDGTAYLRNDPEACANCHVMQDHFDAWVK